MAYKFSSLEQDCIMSGTPSEALVQKDPEGGEKLALTLYHTSPLGGARKRIYTVEDSALS
jgi:hypothetical protein